MCRVSEVQAQGSKKAWLLLTLIMLALFFMNGSLSIVMTVLPDIASDMNSTVADTIWVTIATTLLAIGFLPASGKLGDTLGHKHVWTIGMIIRICIFSKRLQAELSITVSKV